jgi:phosphoglycolate phosphatase
MPPSHVLWDWNGTLLDDVSLVVKTLNEILRPRSMPAVSESDYRRVFKFPVRDYYVELGFDFEKDDWEQITNDFSAIYLQGADAVSLHQNVPEVLQLMRDMGIHMSILSAAEETVLSRLVAQKGISDFFDGIYGLTDHYAASKLEAGKHALADIDALARDTLVIGDTAHDYEVACELGARCVLVCGGHQSEERLRTCDCDVLTSVTDLSDYISNKEDS